MKVSQSMLRMYKAYLNGDECGLVFQGRYITNTIGPMPTNKLMAAGQWFEYMCTGSTPRNSGVIPEAVRLKSGDLNATYLYLAAHVETWRTIAPDGATYGDVIETEKALFGHTLTGITDVKTPTLIGDIKTTSFIDNRWEPFGWGGDASHLATRDSMFQAKFYTLINYFNTGKILPFWFWVFASNSDKCKQIRVEISVSSLFEFLSEVSYLIESIESGQFDPVPSYERCRDCQVDGCEFKQVTPDVIEVSI